MRVTNQNTAVSSTSTILVVEDEPQIAELVIDYLEQAAYTTHWLSDGGKVVPWVQQNSPSLILLDVILPSKSGTDICKEIRAFSKVPIILLTARVEEVDRLLGFNLGADDYICKPFSPPEMVARVRSILSRITATESVENGYRGIHLDEEQHRVSVFGQQLTLTPVEFRLLAIFLNCPGRVYSRAHLMDVIYADNLNVSDRSIDSHIKNLRKKIRSLQPNEEVIHTIYGIGYKLE